MAEEVEEGKTRKAENDVWILSFVFCWNAEVRI